MADVGLLSPGVRAINNARVTEWSTTTARTSRSELPSTAAQCRPTFIQCHVVELAPALTGVAPPICGARATGGTLRLLATTNGLADLG